MGCVSALDALARFYDLDLDGFDEDFALYEGFARRAGGSVLELGCGTGRVAATLSNAGYEVTGLDLSRAMLERARLAAPKAVFVEGDLVSANLGREFDLILAPLGTLLHIELERRVAAFANISRHLRPGGVLVADLPLEQDWSSGVKPLVCQWTEPDPATGLEVSKFVSAESDVASLTQNVTYLFDDVAPDGTVRRTSAQFSLSYFTLSEVKLLLNLAELCLEQVAGGYELEPLTDRSERMIVVATKGSSPTPSRQNG
jgi:SAM-dependent methyltransferase